MPHRNQKRYGFLPVARPFGTKYSRKISTVCVAGLDDATKAYRHLLESYPEALSKSAAYYNGYLQNTVGLELPDSALQEAYDWARISTVQEIVNNSYLGTSLVAGYRTSGVGQRPGFKWFFGRDSLLETSFALNAEGDYATARTALDFISKYQRADGKVPHEISQSAGLVPWFKDYPYPYVSADATPLFIIAMNDYAVESGDLDFVREKWDNVWRAPTSSCAPLMMRTDSRRMRASARMGGRRSAVTSEKRVLPGGAGRRGTARSIQSVSITRQG